MSLNLGDVKRVVVVSGFSFRSRDLKKEQLLHIHHFLPSRIYSTRTDSRQMNKKALDAVRDGERQERVIQRNIPFLLLN